MSKQDINLLLAVCIQSPNIEMQGSCCRLKEGLLYLDLVYLSPLYKAS